MLQVWGRTDSSNVQALMWCIGELGLEHTRYDAGHRFGGTDTEEFAAMNPNRTVPVLQDGANPPLWETGAILRYLAAHYGEGPFWPVDPVARAEVDKWAEWSKINIALGLTMPIFWAVVRTPKKDQDLTAIQKAISSFENLLTIAEERLRSTTYLCGDHLTLADIQFGHVLFRYYDMDIVRSDNLPYVGTYYQRLTERPAYQQHVMVSYEALRVI